MLPVLFIVLSSAALLGALVALFASLRVSLGAGGNDALWSRTAPDRGALLDEKNALLRALKDLEYEHEVGKIDDEDYARLEGAYRARAKEVLNELDADLRPYLSRAEALAGGAPDAAKADKKKAKKKKKAESDAPREAEASEAAAQAPAIAKDEDEAKDQAKDQAKEDATPDEAKASDTPAPLACPKCATVNDPDARFCKKCATPLLAAAEDPS